MAPNNQFSSPSYFLPAIDFNSLILNLLFSLQTSDGIKYLLLTPDRCLIFPSADYVRNLINKHGLKVQTPVVIDCTHIYGADFTAAKVVDTLIKDFKQRNQLLLFLNLKPSVGSTFDGAELEYRVFYDLQFLERAICEIRRKSVAQLEYHIQTISTVE